MKKLLFSNYRSCLLLSIFILITFVTRFLFLEKTATFFWDQAYDLKEISSIYHEKRITLIGPISEGGDKVYSSLTYYMLMPFAVLGNFSTSSTTYGAAFYGFITAVLFIYLLYKINKKSLLGIALIASIWFPLIETSRWAWNPNLILLWIVLGLLFFEKKTPLSLLFSGICLGFSIHHHYLSFIATSAFIFLTLINQLKKKQLKTYLFLVLGFLIPILPFILFDITHPPGLFISRFFLYSQNTASKNLFILFKDFIVNILAVLNYYTTSKLLGILLLSYLLGLVFYDFKKQRQNLVFLAVWILQILAVTFLNEAFSHYFLPGLVFFVIYLFLPRKSVKFNFVLLSTVFLIFGSVLTIFPQVTTEKYASPAWQPNIETVDHITNIIYQEIENEHLSGVNLAVLGSPDPNRYGWKYRSLLEIKNVTILSKYEYFTNNYLFVVSKQSEASLRADPSPEMERFRNEKLVKKWKTNDPEWFIYLFSF